MHHSIDSDDKHTPSALEAALSLRRRPGHKYPNKYIWWFNTYPLEFAEFLLVTALTRGIWLHPLGPYMSFYSKVILISYPR